METGRIRIEDIQRVVCERYSISRHELMSKTRKWYIARPRQIGMYLARMRTPLSWAAIGARFGGYHHTTVIHATQTVEAARAASASMASTLRSLETQLEIGVCDDFITQAVYRAQQQAYQAGAM